MIEARRDEPVCGASVIQKSPTALSEFVRPAPEPTALYVYVWPDAFANGALHASIKSAGKDAPDPSRFAAYAGVVVTKPNASATDATFASFETLIYFPLGNVVLLTGVKL